MDIILKDRVWNENIRYGLGVADIASKMRENSLCWSGHVQSRPNNASARRMEGWNFEEFRRGRVSLKMT